MGLNLFSPHRNQFYIEAEKLSERIFNKEYKYFFKRNMPTDTEIESCIDNNVKEKLKNEQSYAKQLKNVFQHAFVSAYLRYHYSRETVEALGLVKEKFTLTKEVKAHYHPNKYKNAKERAERISFKDGSRDMWNNIEGIKYARIKIWNT